MPGNTFPRTIFQTNRLACVKPQKSYRVVDRDFFTASVKSLGSGVKIIDVNASKTNESAIVGVITQIRAKINKIPAS